MVALALASTAFAMGHDLPSCALEWEVKAALPALLEGCVHHYGSSDVDGFWFAGDAAALVDQLRGFAGLAPLAVVLHSGTPEVRSPWDPVPRALEADWRASLEVDCGRRGRRCRLVATRVDAWVGGNVEGAALAFPAGADVSWHDGGR